MDGFRCPNHRKGSIVENMIPGGVPVMKAFVQEMQQEGGSKFMIYCYTMHIGGSLQTSIARDW